MDGFRLLLQDPYTVTAGLWTLLKLWLSIFLLLSRAGIVTKDSSPLVEVSNKSDASEEDGEIEIDASSEGDNLARILVDACSCESIVWDDAKILLLISFAGTSSTEIGLMYM